VAIVTIVLGVAGCGAGGSSSISSSGPAGAIPVAAEPVRSPPTAAPEPVRSPPTAAPGFGWLQRDAAATGWSTAVIPTGATPLYPPGWRQAAGDAGTATAELLDARHRIVGYLNLTPRQGGETPADWARFRVAHNAQEGDRAVKRLAAGSGLQFRTGRGSCVRDTYTTSTGNRYVELACIVAGSKTTSVIVGASPPRAWQRISPLLAVAIAGFTT
jgi:hypothetical protein